MPMADLIRYSALYLRIGQMVLPRAFGWVLGHFLAFLLTDHTNILPTEQYPWHRTTVSCLVALYLSREK